MKLGFREYTRNHPHTHPSGQQLVRSKYQKTLVAKLHVLQELQ
ncbi:hypothetical protein HanPI659440_Chr13g0522761 [Helianthus annuus]|nr:hypothetical protein HanPI659440_Chr13g0522761 [Helianthus annuus]